MGSNKGLLNEQLISEAMNGKKYSEINHNLQSVIRDLFGYPDENEIIECAQFEGHFKPDIYIKYKGETKYISIKCGRASMVHGENIKDFVLFLRSLGVSKRTQKTILLYHYGDGTLIGNGAKRLNQAETVFWLQKEIQLANDELNRNHDLINKVINRVLFQGIDDNAQSADYIYFGDPEYGQIVSKKQIYTFATYKSWVFYNHFHIGPIFFKPHARYANTPIINEASRNKIHCFWPNLPDVLTRISKRYSF